MLIALVIYMHTAMAVVYFENMDMCEIAKIHALAEANTHAAYCEMRGVEAPYAPTHSTPTPTPKIK